jgi:F0F1-type ATP synthase assembly protein I
LDRPLFLISWNEQRVPDHNSRSTISQGARAWATSLDFVFSIVALGFVGWLIDRWRGTAPWFMLAGLILGLVVGFYRFVKEALRGAKPPTRPAPPDDDSTP